MRVALAALLWQRGLDADAEEQWQVMLPTAVCWLF
jgi:hypothetical protein